MGGSRRVPLPTTQARVERVAARKATASKATAPKATARKATSRKATTRKLAARKAAARKVVTRKVVTRKVAARKVAAREVATREVATREVVAREVVAGKVAARGAATATAAASARKAAAVTGTYVYCVVRAGERPVVASGVEPLPAGGAPRVLALARNRWLIVANVPLKAYGQGALNKRLQDVDWMSRCGVAHQAVIESFLGGDAVVPMTLFTIFANDERAVAEAKKDAKQLDASLDRVAGRVEWVVRVLRGDAVTAASAAAFADPVAGAGAGMASSTAGAAATRAHAGAADATPRSGREFLQAKVNQRQAARRAAEETGQAVDALFTALSGVADEVSDRTEALTASALGSAALLDAAFLVARAEEPQFEQAARRMAQPLADRGFRVSVTGPWPCYSFVSSRSRQDTSVRGHS